MGMNEGVTDARQKVVFHTLRHTFASWLVMRGVPLYDVAKLMGHNTIVMTQRYAHLAPDRLRASAVGLSGMLDKKPATVLPFRELAQGAIP
jgi:integrase